MAAVMRDNDGFILTLMKGRSSVSKTFHVGFPQESEEQVDKINQRLKEDGFLVEAPKRAHAYTFYVEAPGGFTIEVMC